MKIGIVGASASGIYLALLLKQNNPSFHVALLDQESRLGKKLFATGNGRCNLLHDSPSPMAFDHPEIVESALKRYTFSTLLNVFHKWGIPLAKEGDLYYPASFSAPTFVSCLQSLLKEAGIEVSLSSKVFDYRTSQEGVTLISSQGELTLDYVVFASGGKSGKNLGSDGSLFSVFQKHGYHIQSLRPGLCPVKTKERYPSLAGIRVDGSLTISIGDQTFEEEGQVLFKKDSLSGIVTFNAETFLARNCAPKGTPIILSLFPQYSETELASVIHSCLAHPHGLLGLFPKALADCFSSSSPEELARKMKHWVFHYEEAYPFADSQVTIGGVSFQNIDPLYLNSLIEPRVSFVGEVLALSGNCGGYNLTWCLLSALMAEEGIHEILR